MPLVSELTPKNFCSKHNEQDRSINRFTLHTWIQLVFGARDEVLHHARILAAAGHEPDEDAEVEFMNQEDVIRSRTPEELLSIWQEVFQFALDIKDPDPCLLLDDDGVV